MILRNKSYLFCAGISAFVSLTFMAGPVAKAYGAENVPPTASPGRVEQQIPSIDQLEQKTTPQVNIPEVRTEGAPAGAEKVAFVLNSLTVEGNTVYPQAELAKIWQNDLGHTISLDRLYQIAAEITRKYRNDGYIITQTVVPVQTIKGGNVKLQVVEGSLDQIQVEGKLSAADGAQLRTMANHLRGSQPLQASALERYLLLINDMPGVQARSIISPSASVPGKADMRIIVERDPVDFLVGGDNYGSKYLGPWEITGAVQLNDPLGFNDRFLAQLVTAPTQDELYYGYTAYEIPLGTQGTKLTFDLSYSDTTPGYDVRVFGARGFATTLGATVTHPFIRTRNENLTARVRFEGKTSSTKSDLGVTTDDDIRSLRAGLHYEKLSTALGTSVNMADFQISKGLNILGASDEGDADLSRADGNPEYTKVEIEMTRLQRIVQDFNVLVGVKAQKATSALLTSEQFGIGGMNNGYGRGYDPSEVVGDDGYSAKAELQWNTHAFDNTIQSLQLFGFYDVGTVWNQSATTAAGKRDSLASAGFGARAHINDTFSADATLAFPLTADVGTEGDTDPRFYVSLTGRF